MHSSHQSTSKDKIDPCRQAGSVEVCKDISTSGILTSLSGPKREIQGEIGGVKVGASVQLGYAEANAYLSKNKLDVSWNLSLGRFSANVVFPIIEWGDKCWQLETGIKINAGIGAGGKFEYHATDEEQHTSIKNKPFIFSADHIKQKSTEIYKGEVTLFGKFIPGFKFAILDKESTKLVDLPEEIHPFVFSKMHQPQWTPIPSSKSPQWTPIPSTKVFNVPDDEEAIIDITHDAESFEHKPSDSVPVDTIKINIDDGIEFSKLHTQAEEAAKTYFKNLNEFVNIIVHDINSITDHSSFIERHDKESFLNDNLPLLHTAHTIFSFTDPQQARVISEAVQHTTVFVNGLSSVADVLLEEGIGAIAGEVFSLSTFNILSGFTGLIRLFGKNKDSDYFIVRMIQGISQQISQLHQDILEAFRIQSIAMANMDIHVVSGFLKMESLLQHNHQEVILHFDHIKKFIYLDRLYLEGFKKSFEKNERYHILQQINDIEWRDVVDQVKTECLLYSKSMSVEQLKNGMLRLSTTLKKIQRDGMARAHDVSLADLQQLSTAFSIGSKRLSSKSLADNYQLYAEQNLHLLARYLKYSKMESLANPAALYDLSEASRELMKTYRNTYAYLGLPEDPVRDSLNLFMQGITNFEEFINFLSNAKLIENIFDSYLSDIQQFSEYLVEYQRAALTSYYDEVVLPSIKATLKADEVMLASLDKSKTSEFFVMAGKNSDGKGWFEYRWSHWYAEENRWSPDAWNSPGYHSDRPRWVPYGDIDKTKAIYREHHHSRAQLIHQNVMSYHQKIQSDMNDRYRFDKTYSMRFVNYVLYGNAVLDDLRDIPYYFKNEALPFIVSDWHIKQIPQVVFDMMVLTKQQPQFVWSYIPDKGHLNLKISFDSVPIFQQTTSSLPGHALGLNFPESLHYFIYGGMQPVGTCREYDPDLRRFSQGSDIHDYRQKKAIADCGNPLSSILNSYIAAASHCHALYRATVCMPDTIDIVGIYPDANAYIQLPKQSVDLVSSWSYTSIKEEDRIKLNSLAEGKKKQLRQTIIKDLLTKLYSGSTKAFDLDEHLSESFKKNMISIFNRIAVGAKVLKMLFALVIDASEINIDLSWPNIFDSNDILRELDQYSGSRIYLSDLLNKNHESLLGLKPKILHLMSTKKIEHYPFMPFKQELEEFIKHVINNDILPNIIAESRPHNLYQFKQFITELFPTLDSSVQLKLLEISPTLQKGVKQFSLPSSESVSVKLKPSVEPDPIEKCATSGASPSVSPPIFVSWLGSTLSTAFAGAKTASRTEAREPKTIPHESKACPVMLLDGEEKLESTATHAVTLYKPSIEHEHEDPTQLFDHGDWSDEVKRDSDTGKFIFTYNVFQKGSVVGAVEVYEYKLFCISEDGQSNNIVKLTGVLSSFKITKDMNIENICGILPPNLFDRAVLSANRGAEHGVLRGLSNVIAFSLRSSGASQHVADFVKNFCYYGTIFTMYFASYYEQMGSFELYGCLDAMRKAAIDTGKTWALNVGLGFTKKLLQYAGDELAKRKNYCLSYLGKGLSSLRHVVSFGIFAKDALDGPDQAVRVAASLGAGALAEHLTTEVGIRTLQKCAGRKS